MAASWGYFNTVKSKWNTDIIEPCGFPVDMLPEVLASEKDAGVLSHNWFDIPSGTPIGKSNFSLKFLPLDGNHLKISWSLFFPNQVYLTQSSRDVSQREKK